MVQRTGNRNKNKEREDKLSQLDIVALNILFPPVIRESSYEPKLGTTGLFYSARPFYKTCENLEDGETQAVCGPEIGAN